MNEELVAILNDNIKQMKKEMMRNNLFLLVGILVIIFFIIYTHLEASDDRYHLYMNTTRSLESIYNVKIDPYDGSFERKLTTEEMMTRRHLQRWHLRKLFK